MPESSLPPASDELQRIALEALQAATREAEAGNGEQAGALCRAVLDLVPAHPDALFLLGVLERQAGRLPEAVQHFAAALQGRPEDEACWLTYIETLMEARQFATAGDVLALGRRNGLQGETVDALERELDASGKPTQDEIAALGTLFVDGHHEEAIVAARDMIARFPQHGFGWKVLGAALGTRGDLEQAVQANQTATVYLPDDGETLGNLGFFLTQLDRAEEAEEVLRRAIALDPKHAHSHHHLALSLMELDRAPEAMEAARTALELDPQLVNAWSTLASTLQAQGRTAEAVEHFRRAVELKPDNYDAHSSILFAMSHMEDIGADALFEEHLRFGERVARHVGAPSTRHDNVPEPERRLRIGLVSGDLRSHAVANFIEPVLERLARRPGLSLHAYYTSYAAKDYMSERLARHLVQWRDIVRVKDDIVDDWIRADGIDILVDLSGHTSFNRLPLFARKPAPVQVSWVGYPGTTGLAAMDYYLCDPFFLPPGMYDHHFTEKLVQAPVSVAFQPSPSSPEVGPLPALQNGYITFGSFARINKLTRRTFSLWGELLRAIPDARLLMANMSGHTGTELIDAWLAEEGIAPERVRFHPRAGMAEYLGLHQQVDICLDSYPYSGGTTTLHAMWMGVPTLTLESGTAAGRQSASLLAYRGLEQFVVRDRADYVARGLAICADLPALAALRAGLRARFAAATPDAQHHLDLYADGVERALRTMWRRWCAGLAPESFAVPALSENAAPGA